MQYNYNNLPPFKWFVLENFPFIEADFDALTNWQLMCKLGKELSKVVTSVNGIGTQVENLTEAFTSLEDYVANYFDNLDVQEEINNKLDDMAEHGELADIIAQYLSLAGLLVFNTKAELKAAQNLANGSIAMTIGETTYNDGHMNYYKIRPITSGDVVDDNNIIQLTNSETLIAERLVISTKINVVNELPSSKENDAIYNITKYDEINTLSAMPDSEYQYVYNAKKAETENEPNNIIKVGTWNLAINDTYADYLFEGLQKHDKQRKVFDKLGCTMLALQEINQSILFPNKDIYLTELYKYMNAAIGWANYRALMNQGEAMLSSIEPTAENHGVFTYYVTIHQAWQNIRILYNNKTVSMYSVHFSYNGGNEARKQQIDELYTIMQSDTSAYKIVAGDFNFDVEQDASTMLEDFLTAGYKLVNGGQYITRTMAIDEIMVSSNIDILDSGMLTDDEIQNSSDHKPLWAKLELK